MYKLSIIIPIYNSSNYLEQCLQSIQNQSYKNYEVILVNDGSTDDSETICLNFCKNNNQFKYFKKNNGGSSSARNFGLKKVTGDFICFIDSDDYIEINSFETIVRAIKKYNADIIVFGRYKDYGFKKIKVFEEKKDKEYTNKDVMCEMLSGKNIDFACWDKVYKRELWDSVEFPIGLTGEDICVLPQIINKSKKIVKIKECLYNYRYTPNSITNSSYNTHTFDTLGVLHDFEIKFSKRGKKEYLSFNSFKVTQYLFYVKKLLFLDEKQRNELNFMAFLDYLRKNLLIILFNPYIKLKTKVNVFLAIEPKIYKLYLEKKNEI